MHIPANMLHGQICPVTLAVGAVTVAAAAKIYSVSKDKVSPTSLASVTALIFALQMLNFPVAHGTSGHLVGGVLAASLLGIPAGILSLSMVLLVQALFFADGGINALGANVINMALIGAGIGGLIYSFLKAKSISRSAALAIASFVSVVLAALSCSLQVALSGTIPFGVMTKAMLSVHALIGVGEAVMTVVLFEIISRFFSTQNQKKILLRLSLLSAAAVALAPFASTSPDGLESVAMKLHLDFSQSVLFLNWFKDYQFPAIPSSGISTTAAGLAGVVLVWFLTWGMAKRVAKG